MVICRGFMRFHWALALDLLEVTNVSLEFSFSRGELVLESAVLDLGIGATRLDSLLRNELGGFRPKAAMPSLAGSSTLPA
jgi:hypothetical protein